MQALAAALQPALDRSRRPAQPPGRLFLRASFQAAQDQRQTKALGKSLHLFVEDHHQFADAELVQRVDDHARRSRQQATSLALASPSLTEAVLQRNLTCRPVQPGGEGLGPANGLRAACQHQEHGLGDVLDVGGIT